MEAALMTVKKDGPTVGLRFWTCRQDPRCRFFSWLDRPPKAAQKIGVNCFCGCPAVESEGKTVGGISTRFLACGNTERDGCSYIRTIHVDNKTAASTSGGGEAATKKNKRTREDGEGDTESGEGAATLKRRIGDERAVFCQLINMQSASIAKSLKLVQELKELAAAARRTADTAATGRVQDAAVADDRAQPT
jgi:hypothetical protein